MHQKHPQLMVTCEGWRLTGKSSLLVRLPLQSVQLMLHRHAVFSSGPAEDHGLRVGGADPHVSGDPGSETGGGFAESGGRCECVATSR